MPVDPDSVCYKKNYLTEVIIRVDFQSPIEKLKSSLPVEISNSIKKYFPIPEPRKSLSKHIEIGPKKQSIADVETPEYHFHGKNREKTLTITPQAIFAKFKVYTKYEIVRHEFTEIFSDFIQNFNETQPVRLGMRYINNIALKEENPLDWGKYLNSKFLYLFDFSEDKRSLSRIFHNMEYMFEDFNLRFQFGMHNPDYPARIIAKNFILDFDAYKQALIEPGEIVPSLDKFHKKIQEYFELSITENFRNKMNAE